MTGASAALRDIAIGFAGASLALATVCYVIAIALAHEIIQLPLAFYQGVTLERRYGLSTQATARWWVDHVKAGAVGLAFAIVAALILMSLLRWSPEHWWIMASGVFMLIFVALVQAAPVLLMPIFYDFKALDRPELSDRLVALAERAGARVLGVFEWRLGDRTRKANAALAGLGRTRRILLSDTLLAEHSDDEIEVILAHELAHHVHRDIWSGIALQALVCVAVFYVADRLLSRFAPPLGLLGKEDIAGLPLVVLTAGAVSVVFMPVANAFSRAHERRADRYALEVTRNVVAFTSAMKRLGAQNLAEERPSRLVEWLFYSHPPMAARVEAARRWAEGRASRYVGRVLFFGPVDQPGASKTTRPTFRLSGPADQNAPTLRPTVKLRPRDGAN